jgi:hypothetical protein
VNLGVKGRTYLSVLAEMLSELFVSCVADVLVVLKMGFIRTGFQPIVAPMSRRIKIVHCAVLVIGVGLVSRASVAQMVKAKAIAAQHVPPTSSAAVATPLPFVSHFDEQVTLAPTNSGAAKSSVPTSPSAVSQLYAQTVTPKSNGENKPPTSVIVASADSQFTAEGAKPSETLSSPSSVVNDAPLGGLRQESERLTNARERLALAQIEREIRKIEETEGELGVYNLMGRVMFFVVHLILALGLSMAWSEFRTAMARRKVAADETVQELKLSLDGIALKSSLQGTIILCLAFGFYFAYLRFVYPIVIVP